MEPLYGPYVHALRKEITLQPRTRATTLFIGGGTPSLLTPQQLGELIATTRAHFSMDDDAEVTIECNPGTVTLQYLRELRAQGANRLSFGAQSADPAELKLLGREHGFDDVVRAVEQARAAGFTNVNFDLIFGLPQQQLSTWRNTLSRALEVVPDHISLYALTIEQGTPMYDWTRRGEVPYPDPDAAADMYDHAEETLSSRGYEHYEISNWCKPAHEAQHNLIYWRNEPYFGLGAGAHSSDIANRWWKVRRPADYIARAERGESLVMGSETIDARTSRGETMMLGLRLLHEGISHARFVQRHGQTIGHFFAGELQQAGAQGLITNTAERVLLTQRGRFLSNQVMKLFV